MSRTALLLVVIAALVAAGWYWHQKPARVAATPVAHEAIHVNAAAEEPAAQPASQPPVVAEVPPGRKSPDYGAQYRHSDDLLTFLESVAPAAADGDVDAMYYLAVASRRCTREYATLFGPPGKEKSLELALKTEYWTRYYE